MSICNMSAGVVMTTVFDSCLVVLEIEIKSGTNMSLDCIFFNVFVVG